MTEYVKTWLRNNVLHVQLAREAKKNALTAEMYRALNRALAAAGKAADVHVVLLKGGADCFCAGHDFSGFEAPIPAGDEDPGLEFIKSLVDFEKPVVAAVNGPAVGLGATLLLHCDLVYAGSGSYFRMPFVNLGICPEFAATFLLPQWLGHVRAASLLLLGESCGADQWLSFGLLTAITAGDCREFACQQAEKLAQQPVNALLATRNLMRSHRGLYRQSIDAETEKMRFLLALEETGKFPC